MPTASTLLHEAVRNSRRVRGRLQLSRVEVDGVAPTAVVEALKSASLGRPSPEERSWITRIELLRSLLLTSPDPITMIDYGAGTAARFDTGEAQTQNTVERTLGQMTRSSKPQQWAYLIFRLMRSLQPETALEMGACVGVSASYQAAAFDLNGRGRVVTLEGADVLAARTQRTFEELGLTDRASVRLGQFGDTLDEALDDVAPLGFAFIDGHHVESATVDYAEKILPRMADEGVLMFDDVNWSDGMRKAWRTIVDDDRYALTVDLRSVGLAVVSKSAGARRHLEIAYY